MTKEKINKISSIGYTGDLSDFKPGQPNSKEGIIVRDALFIAPSRTYGESLMEPIIREIFGYIKPESGDSDAENPLNKKKSEIKSARVTTKRPNKKKMNFKSLFESISWESNQDVFSRIGKFNDRLERDYDANIQNIKRDHFDELIYILLYSEGIQIFRIKKEEINKENIRNWSDKHGRYDELGKSGQFNVKKNNILEHEEKYFEIFISYDSLAKISKEIK